MSVEHLEFRLLKYIVAVADAGSFTAAAAKVHVSQSTLSTQIGALEDILGIRIFDRERGTALTREGKVLLRYAREGLKTRERIVRTVQAIHAGRMTPLRLGFTPFVHKALLKSVVDLYRDILPECDLVPDSEDSDELIKRIHQGALDAAVVTLPIIEDGLDVAILERERLLVGMKSDDPLAEGEVIPARALDGKVSAFIYQHHHPLAQARLVEMFSGLGIGLRPCRPTTNIDHIQWMVSEGICYSLMRASWPLMNGIVTRPIAGVDWTIDTAIVVRLGNENPALSWFIDELLKHFHIAAQSVDRKPVVSVRVREVGGPITKVAEQNQLPLFRAPNAADSDPHLRKRSLHRKEVLDE